MSTFESVAAATSTAGPTRLDQSDAEPPFERGPSSTLDRPGGGAGSPSLVGSPWDYAVVARELFETNGVNPTLRAAVSQAVDMVPCRWAAAVITDRLTLHLPPLSAATDPELLRRVATISTAAGDSPGMAAFRSGEVKSCPDLSSPYVPARWSAYARDILDRTAIRAVLALPLRRQETTVGVMTLYAGTPRAFEGAPTERALVLAEHAAIAVEAARVEYLVENLQAALVRSRSIGTAIGILVERRRITPDAAFEVLRQLSQDANRKLADAADELVETGTIAGLDVGVARALGASGG